jgi:hypothetical protein
MPLTVIKNDKGKFKNITSSSGLDTAHGWWNSLVAGDFDNDGDIDYAAGNVGLNSYYKTSTDRPVKIYAADYNKDGGYDAVPTLYLPDVKGGLKEFPAYGRDDMIKQMITFKARFTNYNKYALSPINEVLTKEEIENSLKLHANTFSSCFIRNTGNGKFEIKPLPVQAQLSSVFAMIADDVDGDNNLDIIITGNDYGTEIFTGRYDALNGLVLRGDGKGNFTALLPEQSGLYIPGDGKGIAYLKSAAGKLLLLATQNQGPLLVFSKQVDSKVIDLQPGDFYAEYLFTNGGRRREELYYGNSFYSQTGRYITAGAGVKSLIITDVAGKKRSINF